MVQLFYYDNLGKSCNRMLKHEGQPIKIFLFPDDGCGTPEGNTHLIFKKKWWSLSSYKITEVSATKVFKGSGKVVKNRHGDMVIKGKFKDKVEPKFRLSLTTHVSPEDFRAGYSMSGTLLRGRKTSDLRLTHFAMLKRRGHLIAKDDNNNK